MLFEMWNLSVQNAPDSKILALLSAVLSDDDDDDDDVSLHTESNQ